MQVVGLLLQKEAVKEQTDSKDLFARSAYNRYYYSVFLATRKLLAEINPAWGRLAHKSYPETLRGSVIKELTKARTRAVKRNDREFVLLLEGAIRATKALANLIEKAYGVRVVADYEPDELVTFSTQDRFSLKNINITEAHGWDSQVAMWILAIATAWKQLNA